MVAKNGGAAPANDAGETTEEKPTAALKVAPVDMSTMPTAKAISDRCCGICTYYLPNEKNKKIGLCRKRSPSAIAALSTITQEPDPRPSFPPATLLTVRHVDGFFPPTNQSIWCGDWAPLDADANSTPIGSAGSA